MQHWVSLAKDMYNAKSVSDAVGFLLRPPGWLPNGEGDTTEELQKRAKSIEQQPAHAGR
jgi:hypothetical protein